MYIASVCLSSSPYFFISFLRSFLTIFRPSSTGIPGSEPDYDCDWCVLEGSDLNPYVDGRKWWTQNPGAHVDSSNTWPAVPCMSRDSYGARGVLDVVAGENITTTTFVNADHGGFYRFELSYNTGPSNNDFHANPVSDYYALSDNEGLGLPTLGVASALATLICRNTPGEWVALGITAPAATFATGTTVRRGLSLRLLIRGQL
jgi:hypothetical protein